MTIVSLLAATESAFSNVDWLIVGLYFAILLGIAWWVILKSKDTTDDYFLAGRNLGWFVIGASIFASNIGSEHLVGLAGSGATDGVAMAHYELHAWCLLVLGWVMVPFYMRSKVFTMPEFLERRFSPTARWVLSMISLVAYVLTKIAVGIFAGGIVFSVLLPQMQLTIGSVTLDSFWIGSFLVIILTGLYTVLGGLRAVAYTEALQTFVLVFGSILVTIFGLIKLGGWGQLREVCGSDMFNLWKPLVPDGVESTWAPVDQVTTTLNASGEMVKSGRMAWYFNGNYPWLSMLFCAPVIGLWYWCTDQYIVQRALGAPNERQARRGSIFASFLKLLPVFIFIIPGMICFAIYQSGKLQSLATFEAPGNLMGDVYVLDTDAQGNEAYQLVSPETLETWAQADDPRANLAKYQIPHPHEITGADTDVYIDQATYQHWNQNRDERLRYVARQKNEAFPLLVREVLPTGIRGIVVAGLLAALMSSLAGVFNASSTLFTMDFYSKFRPRASQHHLVWVGRVATGAMVLIGLIWIPVIRGGRNLYDYLQGVQSYLAPPIFVVFFLGVFWKRLNSKGCLTALVVGFILGLFRLAIDTPVTMQMSGFENGYAEGSFFWIINKMFFQYYSIFILLVCILVMVVVSFLTGRPDYAHISGLTYGTITAEHRKESRSSWSRIEVILSVALLFIILAVYLYFNG
ncbi:MAG: sodium:solute symporter [Sedimentisphaerales bacterium]|nr:sodium:solute symporter [Sedimentisphaerales bacterium]